MSEKRARQLRQMEGRLDDLNLRVSRIEEKRKADDVWNHALYQTRLNGAMNSAEARAAAKRQARQAEQKARIWKHIAYAALVAAIIVELIAIWAIYFKTPAVPPLIIQPEHAVTMTAETPEAGVSIAQLLEG